jgi:hypothetical protein
MSATIMTQTSYSNYGARVHLTAQAGLDVSRVVHVASLAALETAVRQAIICSC